MGGSDEIVDEEALVEAMTWLRLQLEWEGVLTRLRRRAGVPGTGRGAARGDRAVRAPAA